MNSTLATNILSEAKSIENWVVDIRRRLHQCPELLYELHETAGIVTEVLDGLGIPYQSGIAETGILATIGTGESPCVMLRADMDALPIEEDVDVDFKSRNPGKMHACGHDCHTAMLLGAAKILKQQEAELKGTVKLCFQPAEEGGAGAKRMCDDGIMQNPKVDKVFGIHVWPMIPTGQLTGRPGPFLAAANSFRITVKGKGGHAAMPHLAIDPVTTSAQIVSQSQTIVSREQDPLEAAVISFTTIHGGSAFNVIPAEVVIEGTIRSLSTEGHQKLTKRLDSIAKAIAEAHHCEAEFEVTGEPYPVTSNDDELWSEVHTMGESVVGKGNFQTCAPMMGGEDFAFYGEFAKTCFVALGSGNEAKGCTFGLHHPKFKADESAFPIGTALHVAFVKDHL